MYDALPVPQEKKINEIQQLIFLNENTPIADISIFKLPDGEIAVALQM